MNGANILKALTEDVKYRILVVDDRKENLDAAKIALGCHELITATCYEEGIKVINSFDPDIVITDLNFSYKDKGREEKLGFLFLEALSELDLVVSAVFTNGAINHDQESSELISYKDTSVPGMTKSNVVLREEYVTRPGIKKNNPEAWSNALAFLLGQGAYSLKIIEGFIRLRRVHRNK